MRLTARPVPFVEPSEPAATGHSELEVGKRRDGFLYVSTRYDATAPTPLVVMLHGANGNSRIAWIAWESMAEERGIILLAIDSRGTTWDAMRGHWGKDVEFIDQALERVFSRYNINTEKIAFGGFSDGASYALSLGIANGDLFTHLMAFSPGVLKRVRVGGTPRIFITHGTRDNILPVGLSRNSIVPALRKTGFDVEYLESRLDHTVDWDVTNAAMDWFLEPAPSESPTED